MQRHFILRAMVSFIGIFSIGCGITSGEHSSKEAELTLISPDNASKTNASPLIPTLETNLTADLNPQPGLQPTPAGGIDHFNQALKLEKSGKLTEASLLYTKAAKQNVREAQYNLGYMYEHGEGDLQQDISLAVKWYRKAANQGLPEAQHMLGILYTEGRGVPENYLEAIQWYKKAAEQHFLPAEYQMGALYAIGQGVKANPTIASTWFLKAAQKDLPDAQFQIGWRYARGEGVEQDVIKAYTWLNIAALTGNHKGALEAKRDLMRHMNPDQVTAAQEATAEYLKIRKKDN